MKKINKKWTTILTREEIEICEASNRWIIPDEFNSKNSNGNLKNYKCANTLRDKYDRDIQIFISLNNSWSIWFK